MFPLRPADQLAILTGSILLVAYLVRQILRVRAVRIAVARTRRVSEESNNPAREKDKEAIRRYKDEKSSARREDYRNAFPDLTNPIVTLDQIQQIRYDKELYHQLQNLEDHPGTFFPLPITVHSADPTLLQMRYQMLDNG